MKMRWGALLFGLVGLLPRLSTGLEIGITDSRISFMGPEADVTHVAGNPAVAYNAVDDEFFIVWSGDDVVDNEFEIYGRRFDALTGAALGDMLRISAMGPDGDPAYGAMMPSVAYNPQENEYLVVWMGDDNSGLLVDGEYEIYGQRLDAATGVEVGENDFRISDMGPEGSTAFFASSPNVAYNSLRDEYLVVWASDDDTAPMVDNEREVFGQRLDAKTGAEMGVNDFRISDMGPDGDATFGAGSARVAYDPADDQYLVVWQGDDNTGALIDNEWEVYGQLLDGATGAEIGANDFRVSDLGPDGSIAFGAQNPRLAYDSFDHQFLVVWSGSDTTFGLGNEVEIMGQRLDAATGAEVGENDFRISDMGADNSSDYWAQRPNVTYNPLANEYFVVWLGDDDTSPNVDEEFEIFAQRLDASTGAEVGENDFRVSHMGPDGDVAFKGDDAAAAFSPAHNRYLVLWDGDDDTPPLVDNEFEIFGRFFVFPECGNGFVDSGEDCDDGNLQSGDGCSDDCLSEPPVIDDGGDAPSDPAPIDGGGSPASSGGCSLVREATIFGGPSIGAGLRRD